MGYIFISRQKTFDMRLAFMAKIQLRAAQYHPENIIKILNYILPCSIGFWPTYSYDEFDLSKAHLRYLSGEKASKDSKNWTILSKSDKWNHLETTANSYQAK